MVDAYPEHRRSVHEGNEKTVEDIIKPLAGDNRRLQAAVALKDGNKIVYLRLELAGWKLEHECDERDRAAIKRLRNRGKIATRRVTDEYDIFEEVKS